MENLLIHRNLMRWSLSRVKQPWIRESEKETGDCGRKDRRQLGAGPEAGGALKRGCSRRKGGAGDEKRRNDESKRWRVCWCYNTILRRIYDKNFSPPYKYFVYSSCLTRSKRINFIVLRIAFLLWRLFRLSLLRDFRLIISSQIFLPARQKSAYVRV